MNPFGPPVVFASTSNGNLLDIDADPHVTTIIHGTWLVVYSWPPVPTRTPQPPEITLGLPSKLEAVLFGCRCRQELADKFHPVKVYTDKTEVQACELINEEGQVAAALDLIKCECRSTPLGEKFAALPVNENVLLHYQRLLNVTYSDENPNICKLLFRRLPSRQEIQKTIEGLDVERRRGDYTFMINQE